MTREIGIKICGLRHEADIAAAADAGARYIGFNFFPKSPRYLSLDAARELAATTPAGLAKVGLVVDMDDLELDQLVAAVPLDMIQLHGQETPERVAFVKARYGLPVMKVLGISAREDLAAIDAYAEVADQFLLDAKPPKDAVLPGGNGLAFDWQLLAGRKYWTKPWMLAGGLTPDNVAAAIRATGARQVDVASGVEAAPGEKSPELIRAFCEAAQGAA